MLGYEILKKKKKREKANPHTTKGRGLIRLN